MWVTFLLQIARTICQFYRIVCWNDALNVLTAMDIISKDKKEIHWKGMPHTTPNHIQELKVFSHFMLIMGISLNNYQSLLICFYLSEKYRVRDLLYKTDLR